MMHLATEIPAFFTPGVVAEFFAATKNWLKFGAPLILIIFALFFGEQVIGVIVGMFYRKKDKDDNDEDDYEIHRY